MEIIYAMFIAAILWKVVEANSAIYNHLQEKHICDDEEITLGQGPDSAMLVSLRPTGERRNVCRTKIVAPDTHLVHFSIMELPAYEQFDRKPISGTSCNMTVFQGDLVWHGDLCSSHLEKDVDLLNHEFVIVWRPPVDIRTTHHRKILITAVGQGETCKRKDHHTCMRIGHDPLFCVSEHLICDGYRNCPRGYTRSDEEFALCNPMNSLQHFQLMLKNGALADNLLNTLRTKNNQQKYLPPKSWIAINDILSPTSAQDLTTTPESEKEKTPSALESVSITLSQYGPWGYMLLGMLICGTVLMFCGLIECLKRPKREPENLQTTQQQQQPTVVVIDDQQRSPSPPRYDDLDPPSYNTLFPNGKVEINPSRTRNETEEDRRSNEQNTRGDEPDVRRAVQREREQIEGISENHVGREEIESDRSDNRVNPHELNSVT